MEKTQEIEFYKYQGAGDDFIVIDNRDGRYDDVLNNEELVRKMCLRHFGVDADGLIEVRQNKEHGLQMVWHTGLGFINTMCGNGLRVFASFVKISGIHPGVDDVPILAGDGMHYGNYDADKREGWGSFRDIPVSAIDEVADNEYILNTGIPHMVKFCDFDVSTIEDANKFSIPLTEKWRKYWTKTSFLLVNYVQEKDGVLHCRCSDRNIGKEPIACGTGTAAIGVCYAVKTGLKSGSEHEAQIQWPGGRMTCHVRRNEEVFTDIRICGPVRYVFKGTFFTNSLE